jgi:hypothetical protein
MRKQVLLPGGTSRCWLRFFWLAFKRLDIGLVKHKASLYRLSHLARDRCHPHWIILLCLLKLLNPLLSNRGETLIFRRLERREFVEFPQSDKRGLKTFGLTVMLTS